MKKPSASRADWSLDKIVKVDKRQGIARVLTKIGEVTRKITNLFPLELHDAKWINLF